MQETFHCSPVPVLVGQPHTGKSFIAKVVGSLLGLKSRAKYDKLSLPKAAGVLEQSLWFYYDDPTDGDVFKALVTSVSIQMDNDLMTNTVKLEILTWK